MFHVVLRLLLHILKPNWIENMDHKAFRVMNPLGDPYLKKVL